MKEILSNKRMCVVTKKRCNAEELIRITNIKDKWVINDNKKIQGRSFYIQKDKNLIDKFLNAKKRNVRKFVLDDNLKKELLNYAQNL